MIIITIIGAIISALQAIPQIIAIVKEIIALLQSLKGTRGFDKAEVMTEFRSALKLAREKKDVSGLVALHAKLGAMLSDSATSLRTVSNGPGMPLR